MLTTTLAAALPLLALTTAHFTVDYPYWRGDSFAASASQWIFPCANITETTNRTQWPPTSGSLKLEVHHPWALTYVNLGLGTNITSFNISLVNSFNQTGNGTFCLRETGRAALAAGLAEAGLSAQDIEGRPASLQVVQIASSGAALFNCADITFNASAGLLADDECRNSTGVAGVPIVNAGATPTQTGGAGSSSSPGAAAGVRPMVGGGVVAGVVGALVGML